MNLLSLWVWVSDLDEWLSVTHQSSRDGGSPDHPGFPLSHCHRQSVQGLAWCDPRQEPGSFLPQQGSHTHYSEPGVDFTSLWRFFPKLTLRRTNYSLWALSHCTSLEHFHACLFYLPALDWKLTENKEWVFRTTLPDLQILWLMADPE